MAGFIESKKRIQPKPEREIKMDDKQLCCIANKTKVRKIYLARHIHMHTYMFINVVIQLHFEKRCKSAAALE